MKYVNRPGWNMRLPNVNGPYLCICQELNLEIAVEIISWKDSVGAQLAAIVKCRHCVRRVNRCICFDDLQIAILNCRPRPHAMYNLLPLNDRFTITQCRLNIVNGNFSPNHQTWNNDIIVSWINHVSHLCQIMLNILDITVAPRTMTKPCALSMVQALAMFQWMHHILASDWDDPNIDYIVVNDCSEEKRFLQCHSIATCWDNYL